jgi:hypothetical protein
MLKQVMMLGAAMATAGTLVGAQGTAQPGATPQATTAQAPAQPPRPASPAGSSQTQIGSGAAGKWIEITYGRPIRRGRTDLWGSGATYGKTLLAGAPIWRAGANVTTRLKTEVPLQIGGKPVPAGEYSVFVELKSPTEWTLVLSSWPAQQKYDKANTEALWGGYGYTPDKDVARVAMQVDKLPMSVDQLTWNFADVTPDGGKLVLMWDTVVASAPFTVSK